MFLESSLVNLAAAARKLVEEGLASGGRGSVSLRWREQCYISPADARLDRLSAADFVPLAIAGGNTWQVQRASSEQALHRACHQARPQAGAVLLTHPPHCVALGCAGLALRAITPDFYRAVGAETPLLPYAAPASQALAAAVGALMADHSAILLRNRGLIVAAASVDEALARTLLVEEAARIVLLAHAASGACVFLTAEQMEALEEVA